jgi:acetyl esterase/lipase
MRSGTRYFAVTAALLPLLALSPAIGAAVLPPAAQWAGATRGQYVITPNVTYGVENNYDLKLDVYDRADVATPQPTLIFIHGGGWVGGNKEYIVTSLLPWMAQGWNVVNVEYRLARVSPAPAAVEDCLCALRWVARNAEKYHFDLKRMVVTGESAGGHLALTTGMIPESSGLARQCPGPPLPKVAAIVDWFGISDVAELLDGPNERDYAVAWLGSRPDRAELARRVSPLTYVRAGQPPVFIIHGTADPTVPYAQATRLHEALDRAGVKNQFFSVANGKHGHFDGRTQIRIYTAIREFLDNCGIEPPSPSAEWD